MKHTVLMLLLICSSIFSSAQRNGSGLRSGQMQGYNPILSSSVREFNGSNNAIEGSRFVFEHFNNKASIYIADQLYRAEGLNIDALKNDIILDMGQDSILVLDKGQIDSITIDGRLFKTVKSDDRIYEVLYQHYNIALLATYDCRIKKGIMNVMMGTTEKDRYTMAEKYFLYTQEKGLDEFLMRKRDVLGHFPERQSEIKALIREMDLDLSEPQDVVKVFQFYYEN